MKSLVGGTAAALVLIGLLTSACGDDDGGGSSKTPAQLCNEIATSMCSQIFTCLTPDIIALAGLPATEPACVTKQKTDLGCDSATVDNACTGSEKYHADDAAKCSSQIKAASCSQIISNGENFEAYA